MSYELPTPVQWALNRLTSCAYEAYAVGGCVRDMLLDVPPHDWDVCTSASPKEVIDCFADVRVVTTGIKHGTVTAMLGGEPVEITTYRIDGGYADHRHPDDVQFTRSLREDLKRRDFTINAMAYRPETGVIDFYGGQDDLRRGLIRCVGDPSKRFEEDALRMLRALRFASRYGFAIEARTAEALLAHREQLRYVAQERILSELGMIDYALVDARFLPALQVAVPELVSLDAPSGLPPEPAIRLASLLRGLSPDPILLRLRASKALRERVNALVAEMDTPLDADPVSIRRLLSRVGPGAAAQLMVLTGNDAAAQVLREVLLRGDAYAVGQLDISGKDLVKLGLAGKQVGLALRSLLDQVMEGALPNERHKLLKAAEIATAIFEAR